MAFNSNTYHANKQRRRALEALAAARQPPPWTSQTRAEWTASRVVLARAHWRSYLSHRSLKRMSDDARRMCRGEITPAEFTAKWRLNP